MLHEVVTLRNSLRPVNRLPPLILASCATLVSGADPRPIVSLTHVCRYWHKSITSSQRNWASIATAWKRLVPLCLERAGTATLAVDLSVSEVKGDFDFLVPLFSHVPRIAHLSLTEYSSVETVADDLPGFLSAPMSSLTSLELQQTEEPADLFPSIRAPVPPVFTAVSKLKSLRLTKTPLYPPLFSIASLRELELSGYKDPFRLEQFIPFLDSNPNLEYAELDIRFLGGPGETTSVRRAFLPRLRHLSFTCSRAIDSKRLLSHVSLPRGVRIEVTSTLSDQSAELLLFLPSPLTPILELLHPITTIKTQVTPRELQVIGGSSTFTFRSPRSPPLNAHREFTLFPTSTVREFHADIRPLRYSVAGVFNVMNQLPALEILALANMDFPARLAKALTVEPVLCPALKTIAFLDCNIDSETVEELGEAITRRRDLIGAGLYRLVIVSSSGTILDSSTVRKLRGSVPCVEIRVDDDFPDLS